MKQITIFANGRLTDNNIRISSNQIIIAADGGARHLLRLGYLPDFIVGDFDSLTPEETRIFETKEVKLVRFSREKDETDLELALDIAKDIGASEITLYGLLGDRWDMTFSNLLLLTASKYAEIHFCIVEGNTTAYILRKGESLTLQGHPGSIVSVIPLSDRTRGVSYQGLKWPLENESLPFGSPRGLSNLMISNEAHISLKEGILLVFHILSDQDEQSLQSISQKNP